MSSLTPLPPTSLADDLFINVPATGAMKTQNIYNVNLDAERGAGIKDITEIQFIHPSESDTAARALIITSRADNALGHDDSGSDNSAVIDSQSEDSQTPIHGDGDPRPAQIILNSYDGGLPLPYTNESSIILDAQFISVGSSGMASTVDFNNAHIINFVSSGSSTLENILANSVFSTGNQDGTSSLGMINSIAYATGTSSAPGVTNAPALINSAITQTGQFVVFTTPGAPPEDVNTSPTIININPAGNGTDQPVVTIGDATTSASSTLTVIDNGTSSNVNVGGTNSVADNGVYLTSSSDAGGLATINNVGTGRDNTAELNVTSATTTNIIATAASGTCHCFK